MFFVVGAAISSYGYLSYWNASKDLLHHAMKMKVRTPYPSIISMRLSG
jgi:hypothetical protein